MDLALTGLVHLAQGRALTGVTDEVCSAKHAGKAVMSIAKNGAMPAKQSVVPQEHSHADGSAKNNKKTEQKTTQRTTRPPGNPRREAIKSQIKSEIAKVATVGIYRCTYRTPEEYAQAVIWDRETLEAYLEPMLTPKEAVSLAQVCIRFKEAVMGNRILRAINSLDDGFEAAYVQSAEHQAAMKLYALSQLGHVSPWNEPLVVLNKAISESLAQAADFETDLPSRPKRPVKMSRRSKRARKIS